MAEWEHPRHLYRATKPISHQLSVRDVITRGWEKGNDPAHGTKGMLKSPALTAEITDASAGPGKVWEQPLPRSPVGQGLGFPLPGALRPQERCCSCHNVQRRHQLSSRSYLDPSGQPHKPQGPLSILPSLPLSPCPGTDPFPHTPQVS